jgi:hypothetical protein
MRIVRLFFLLAAAMRAIGCAGRNNAFACGTNGIMILVCDFCKLRPAVCAERGVAPGPNAAFWTYAYIWAFFARGRILQCFYFVSRFMYLRDHLAENRLRIRLVQFGVVFAQPGASFVVYFIFFGQCVVQCGKFRAGIYIFGLNGPRFQARLSFFLRPPCMYMPPSLSYVHYTGYAGRFKCRQQKCGVLRRV